jgi:hypothetical protein
MTMDILGSLEADHDKKREDKIKKIKELRAKKA